MIARNRPIRDLLKLASLLLYIHLFYMANVSEHRGDNFENCLEQHQSLRVVSHQQNLTKTCKLLNDLFSQFINLDLTSEEEKIFIKAFTELYVILKGKSLAQQMELKTLLCEFEYKIAEVNSDKNVSKSDDDESFIVIG